MKYGIFAVIILFLASCSSQETEDSIRDQINSYKKDVYTLNQKISDLEKKLKVMNSGDKSTEKLPVEVMALSYEPFNHYIKVSGTAEAVKEAFISPEVSGQIREIYVKEGDYVERGQLLARLNT
jgi:multidrug efflux pump subunit AcrA (membrane-fusion protein)